MQRAQGKALSVNQRMLLKEFLLPAPCAMRKGQTHFRQRRISLGLSLIPMCRARSSIDTVSSFFLQPWIMRAGQYQALPNTR